MNNFPIYLINLDRSPERLASFTRQALSQNLTFTRIRAIDGQEPGFVQPSASGKNYFRRLSAGEVACYLSHLSALQHFLDEGHAYAVLLEDDCQLAPNFAERLNNLIARQATHPCWDILKLHGRKKGMCIRDCVDDRQVVEHVTVPVGSMGTLWSRAAALAFVARHAHRPAQRPLDVDLRYPWELNCRLLTVTPALVSNTEHCANSSIGQKKPAINTLSAALMAVSKLAYQCRFVLASRCYNLKQQGWLTSTWLEMGRQFNT